MTLLAWLGLHWLRCRRGCRWWNLEALAGCVVPGAAWCVDRIEPSGLGNTYMSICASFRR